MLRVVNKPIKCGVPQGAVLSPTLFSIYINDIPVITCKNKSCLILFADDVVTFFIFKNPGHVKYMLTMENWLNKWRLIGNI